MNVLNLNFLLSREYVQKSFFISTNSERVGKLHFEDGIDGDIVLNLWVKFSLHYKNIRILTDRVSQIFETYDVYQYR
jgi:hypothetical protein